MKQGHKRPKILSKIEQKGMTFDHEVVVNSHAFLLDHSVKGEKVKVLERGRERERATYHSPPLIGAILTSQ